MRTVAFEKWEGLGNDFVVVDQSTPVSNELVLSMCDRRRGIGADGILVVDAHEPRMSVFNADGSRPEMCGNGVRCVMGFLHARNKRSELDIHTDAGVKRCRLETLDGLSYVTVDMGIAKRTPSLVVNAFERTFTFECIDIGNPHAITFEPTTRKEIDRIGPTASTTPPQGTNVEFCRVLERDSENFATLIETIVWERGVGRTLACGTGACAAAALSCQLGISRYDQPIRVQLPGGVLTLVVNAKDNAVQMTGPARRVFTGEWPLAASPQDEKS